MVTSHDLNIVDDVSNNLLPCFKTDYLFYNAIKHLHSLKGTYYSKKNWCQVFSIAGKSEPQVCCLKQMIGPDVYILINSEEDAEKAGCSGKCTYR